MKVKITIEGADQLVKNLNRIGKTASRRSLRKSVQEGAKPIEKRMKEIAPVDTGKLRDSIRTKVAYQSSRAARVSIGPNIKPHGNNRVGYDVFQEYGTSFHAAQPYARPAADYEKDQAVEIVRATVAEAILEEVKKLGH